MPTCKRCGRPDGPGTARTSPETCHAWLCRDGADVACWQFALAIALRERDEVRAEREAAQVEAGVSKLAMEDMVRHMVQREAFDQERRRAVTAEAERDALAARADKAEQSVALARHALDARYGSQHEPGCELRRGVGDGCTCHSDRDITIQRLDVAEDDRATAEARATAAEVRAEKAEAERDEARQRRRPNDGRR